MSGNSKGSSEASVTEPRDRGETTAVTMVMKDPVTGAGVAKGANKSCELCLSKS